MDESKMKKMKIFAIVHSIFFVCVIITLSVFLGLSVKGTKIRDKSMEGIYQQSYYTVMTNINDIENGLAKLTVSRSETYQEETLEKIAMNCEIACSSLTILGNRENNINSLMGYFNKIGDYSKYLLKVLKQDEKISINDLKIISQLKISTLKIGKELAKLKGDIEKGYSFVKDLGNNEILNGIIGDLDNNSVEYPSLIYDGPFSDSIKDREAYGVTGEEISVDEGIEKAKEYLKGYSISDVKLVGENNSKFSTYLYEVKILGDKVANIQLTKKGGHLVMFDIYKNIDDPKLSLEECEKIAEKYCIDIGMKDMKAVWVSNNDSYVFVNLVISKDDILYYADMVKVKIALDNGEVIGFEGINYLFNHRERAVEVPSITEDEARINVFEELEIKSIRCALIPLSQEKEVLTFEIYGTVGEEKYFIYINCETGKEVKILRVIDSSEGELLM